MTRCSRRMLVFAAGASTWLGSAHDGGAAAALVADAAFGNALRSLSAESGRLVGSERPLQVPTSLDFPDQPWEATVAALSRHYDLHWVSRPGRLIFQRRYRTFDQLAELDLDELRAISADLYKLVHPFNPRPIDVTVITDKRDFLRSLTADQLAAMRTKEGLPFRALGPDQRKLWHTINSMHAYADADADLARLSQLLARWQQTTLSAPFLTPSRREWDLAFPTPGQAPGVGRVIFPVRSLKTNLLFERDASGKQDAERKGSSIPAFARVMTINSGPGTVESLILKLRQVTGKELVVPGYAWKREVWLYGSRARARDVIAALEDLFGWELRAGQGGKYLLDRPAVRPARNAVDLQLGLQRAVPPALHHLLSRSQPEMEAWRAHQMALVISEADQPKLTDQKILVTTLSDEKQKRLAQVITVGLLHPQSGLVLNRDTPRHWIRAPEEGFFRWDGPPAPIPGGRNPIVWFGVIGSDGILSRWGWGVGTSSLDRKQ